MSDVPTGAVPTDPSKAINRVAAEIGWSRHALNRIASSVGRSLNRGLVIGIALLTISALLVSSFQPWVAIAIVGYTPPFAFLAGAFLNLAPLVAPAFVFAVALAGIVSLGRAETGRAFAAFAWAAIGGVGVGFLIDRSLVPLWSLFAALILWVVLVLLSQWWRRSKHRDRDADDDGVAGAVAICVSVWLLSAILFNPALSPALSRPFVPPEVVEVGPGGGAAADKFIAYTLDVDPSGQWTTLLLEDNRTIMHVPSGEVESRTVCRLDGDSPSHPYFSSVEPSKESATPLCSALAGGP